jgi:hypothetical protein
MSDAASGSRAGPPPCAPRKACAPLLAVRGCGSGLAALLSVNCAPTCLQRRRRGLRRTQRAAQPGDSKLQETQRSAGARSRRRRCLKREGSSPGSACDRCSFHGSWPPRTEARAARKPRPADGRRPQRKRRGERHARGRQPRARGRAAGSGMAPHRQRHGSADRRAPYAVTHVPRRAKPHTAVQGDSWRLGEC